MKLFLLLILTLPYLSQAKDEIHIFTYELNPYVGETLKSKGALSEIIESAFNQVNKEVKFQFYPAVGAKKAVIHGRGDAVFPIPHDKKNEFIYSNKIPGIKLGLLRRKLKIFTKNIPIKKKRIGIVRNIFSNITKAEYPQANFIEALNYLQLLKMLHKEELDYILIDKYTAADLMVDHLPYLIGRFEFLESTAKAVDLRLGFSKKKNNIDTTVEDFNRGLKEIQKNKKLNQILYSHGLLTFRKDPKKKILRIATVSNNEMVTMQKLSSQFEKENPEIQLDWKTIDENILRKRLLSDLAVSAGEYDIMTIGSYEAAIWAKNKWLKPLNSIDSDDFISSIKDSLSYKKTLYAVPFYGESSMLYYRKDLLKEKNISIPQNLNYHGLLEISKKIHDPKNEIYGICLRGKAGWGENMALISTMVSSFGGQWFDMNWNAKLDTPEWTKAVTIYKKLLSMYGPPRPYLNGYNENLKLFSDGKCGLWLDATVAAGSLFDPKKSKVHDKVGFASMPVQVNSKGSSWLWSWALAVPNSSQLSAEAFKFISWATSKSYINLVGKKNGWTSVPPGTRKSTYSNPKYQKAAPFSKYVYQAIENTNPLDNTLNPSPYTGIQFVNIPEFPSIGTKVGIIISELLKSNLTVNEALDKAQKSVESQMSSAKY